MDFNIKYQYTYFIYPYLIEEKQYQLYLYELLKNPKCKLKLFDRKKDVGIDTYFLPELKQKMFWSLDMTKSAIKQYETMDKKMQATLLSKQACNMFEYELVGDVPGKIGEKNGIFFDITKVEIICFDTGVCFLLFKTALSEEQQFSDVLNFNYKFRDINSKTEHTKQYEAIKIQTEKLNNMQDFSEFIYEIAGSNIKAKQINLDTDRLITYAYVCLNQNEWNENVDIKLLEKEFEKYRKMKPAEEQLEDVTLKEQYIYKEKYLYYGFSNNATVLFTCDNNIKNYTTIPFKYENEQLYHFIFNLYKKIYLKKLNYELQQTNQFKAVKEKFLTFAKKDWIYEVTNNEMGIILEKYYTKEQTMQETFVKLKQQYDLLYKDYEIEKTKRSNKWITGIILVMIILNIINICIIFGK